MRYITLDTCVWLGLIKVGLHDDDNVFEEICYWIENKHIIHITPENIIHYRLVSPPTETKMQLLVRTPTIK